MSKMGESTTLTLATSKTRSLRTTVPMSIVKHFDLKQGNKLFWEIKAQDNELIIIVIPIKDVIK